MTRTLRTHEITEVEPGVFSTVLEPCSAAVLPNVLVPGDSHIWLVEHAPDARLLWGELRVPLAAGAAPERLPVRGLTYDLQLPTAAFLARVVLLLGGDAGVTLLELSRPVPDSLRYREVMALPRPYAVLRQVGWRLTFALPHGGEYAEVTAAERATLEALLANPVIAAGKAAGELP